MTTVTTSTYKTYGGRAFQTTGVAQQADLVVSFTVASYSTTDDITYNATAYDGAAGRWLPEIGFDRYKELSPSALAQDF